MSELSDLIAKVEMAVEEVPKMAAEKMEPDIEKAVQDGINWWYAAYPPTYYVRTGGLNRGSMAGLTQEFGGDVLTVRVDSSHVPEHKNDSGDVVFDYSFINGIHGSKYVAVTPPPWMLYEENFQKIADEKMQEAANDFWRDNL